MKQFLGNKKKCVWGYFPLKKAMYGYTTETEVSIFQKKQDMVWGTSILLEEQKKHVTYKTRSIWDSFQSQGNGKCSQKVYTGYISCLSANWGGTQKAEKNEYSYRQKKTLKIIIKVLLLLFSESRSLIECDRIFSQHVLSWSFSPW